MAWWWGRGGGGGVRVRPLKEQQSIGVTCARLRQVNLIKIRSLLRKDARTCDKKCHVIDFSTFLAEPSSPDLSRLRGYGVEAYCFSQAVV